MQINPISNPNINQNRTPSFGAVEVYCKEYTMRMFKNTKTLQKYIKHAESLEKIKINLRDLTEKMDLSQTDRYVLKNYFTSLDEQNISDFPVTIVTQPSYGLCNVNFMIPKSKDIRSYNNIYDITAENINLNLSRPEMTYDEPFIVFVFKDLLNKIRKNTGFKPKSKYPKLNFSGLIKKYENSSSLPNEKALISIVKKSLEYYIKNISKEIDAKLANEEKEMQLRAAVDKAVDKYFGIKPKVTETDKKDLLPVSSLVCTLEDITNYLDTHSNGHSLGFMFDKPVTKDGETLLIALAHIKPTPENIDKYQELVENLIKEKNWINFNQTDSMGIPFIDHVINSENWLLLAAASHSGLIYTPELENTFNSIRDPKFKETVLNSDLFNNIHNIKYKTIFGQPNPKI